ncbi:biotin--[acetyl-CoA-carboxylase] ligase [Agrilactobacillus yilanensis]|uniref:Bifunctional ligase/repressor BirA n=1 Tax=Agrilactobacillus yilanensis TaxID=2485997 RepID=A0ABW4J6D1_9LACO|nr:biotin--[acetyl-CoA-carboxylase] ligase [Agrilactobacillus yilanensis]
MSELLTIFIHNQGRWLSGEQLAEQLQISRPAVWKQIQKLKQQGYQIASQQGLGYQYLGTENLDQAMIQAALPSDLAVTILTFDQLGSTNDYSKQYLSQHPISQPVVILADEQTNGHGRLGRSFYAPKTTGLYFSILLPLQPNEKVIPSLMTTGTGTAVVRTLRQYFPQTPVQLKWINDIVLNHKKCGGILTEAITDLESGQISHLIVGVGLNLSTTEFPDDLQHIAGALTTEPVNRNQLVVQLIQHFFAMYATYQTGDFLTDYRNFSAILGREVTIVSGSQTTTGTVIDFDYQGQLVLRDADGQVQTINSGEVKLTSGTA